ncbi:MAG: hypothetical protein RBR08_03935 [Desulforegulaceae bacterium]|jgi:hypothetical protein|nr:hypothetical protein [Desulforegulaceae bacterium]
MDNKKPKCFGDLDIVFPMSKEGYRKTPDNCINCSFKKECICLALDSEKGIEKKSEMIDASYESGNINFFARWAKKKSVENKKKKGKKNFFWFKN